MTESDVHERLLRELGKLKKKCDDDAALYLKAYEETEDAREKIIFKGFVNSHRALSVLFQGQITQADVIQSWIERLNELDTSDLPNLKKQVEGLKSEAVPALISVKEKLEQAAAAAARGEEMSGYG